MQVETACEPGVVCKSTGPGWLRAETPKRSLYAGVAAFRGILSFEIRSIPAGSRGRLRKGYSEGREAATGQLEPGATGYFRGILPEPRMICSKFARGSIAAGSMEISD